jgi:epoxide hydrolase-like predicted phosphatase
MSIEAVLFDFGGVYTTSPFDVFVEAAAEFGAAPERMLGLVFGPYDRDTDHPWHRLERGELPLLDARREIMETAEAEGLAFDPLTILARLATGGGGARDEVVASTELFDAVIDSSEVGVRKPDPAIFDLALREIGGIAPERAVFLDDFLGNVEAARRLGMHGVLVENDPAGALAELERLLG